MNRLTPEQRQKVRELVPGKFYKITRPKGYFDQRIVIGRFKYLVNADRPNAELGFGNPAFIQNVKDDPYSFERCTGDYYFSVGMIDLITPIDAPEGAPADWEPYISSDGRTYKMPHYLLNAPVNMSSYDVNEPLSAENWAARENAMRKGAPWSKPGATGGGSAAAGSTRKNRRIKRKSRKARRMYAK